MRIWYCRKMKKPFERSGRVTEMLSYVLAEAVFFEVQIIDNDLYLTFNGEDMHSLIMKLIRPQLLH